MAGILIIAHAPFATALKDCVAHIYHCLPARLGALDIEPDGDCAQLLQAAHGQLQQLREKNGVLVLTDLYGATPSNIAAQLARLPDVRVLTGVNLPMVVRAVCYRAVALDILVDKALAGGIKGMQPIDAAASDALEPGSSSCSAGDAESTDTRSSEISPSCCRTHHGAM